MPLVRIRGGGCEQHDPYSDFSTKASGPMVETSKCNILFRLRSRSSSFVDDLLQLSAQEVVLQPRIALFVRPQRVGNGREVIY